ncbi:MAG: V-type ATP synthase subunit I, partial [Clostridiales bacterium]|nr:V-type ATP synthase subunit I [Clostridiales bacterium]
MAIVEMSRLSVICLNSRKTRFIKDLMDLGFVEIDSPSGRLSDNPLPAGTFVSNNSAEVSRLDAQIASLGAAIDALEGYKKGKQPLFKTRREINAGEFVKEAEQNAELAAEMATRASDTLKKITDDKGEINRLELLIKGLEPWKSLDLPLETTQTKTSVIFMGALPVKTNMNDVINSVLEAAPSVVIQQVSTDKTQAYVCVVCLKEQKNEALDALRKFGFISVSLGENKGTAVEAQKTYAERIEVLKAEIADNEKNLTDLAEHISEIEIVYDDFLLKRDRAKAVGDMINTKKVFCFEGWLPTGSAEKVRELLDKYECYYEISEPVKDEETPILLKNNKFATPFEAVTEMYALPLATEVDPTPLLAPFYFIFFGMMLSDAAYGAIIAVACFVLLKKFPRMSRGMYQSIKMFMYCGISTLIWGILFGGYFGNIVDIVSQKFFRTTITVPALWFIPLNDPMKLLMYSMLFGMIHLFVGLGIKGYMCLKEKKIMDFFCDVVLWFMLLIGLILMLLPSEIFSS